MFENEEMEIIEVRKRALMLIEKWMSALEDEDKEKFRDIDHNQTINLGEKTGVL